MRCLFIVLVLDVTEPEGRVTINCNATIGAASAG
jgi:hypothetical protein